VPPKVPAKKSAKNPPKNTRQKIGLPKKSAKNARQKTPKNPPKNVRQKIGQKNAASWRRVAEARI
jgi:hypothetical protein